MTTEREDQIADLRRELRLIDLSGTNWPWREEKNDPNSDAEA
jgi:hypothetical protein